MSTNTSGTFPLPQDLENDRIKLVPYIPSFHSEVFAELSKKYPETYKYIPWGHSEVQAAFDSETFLREHKWLLFAILDKTRPPSDHLVGSDGALAGTIAFIDCDPRNLSAELGAVLIFPPFQRTHVASNAVGLMLQYALNRPSEGGLGLRRVVWLANRLNEGSIRLAKRFRFQQEGVLRWHMYLEGGPAGNGKLLREEDPKPGCPGRDTALFSLCWDDWEGGGAKENSATVMLRIN
ncbi:acyl-CoA N-acyltransferase [Ephemerocybe angulata]|uniref:Acyl-CoA N-acyltransferase n=1 Tax=Ephemerocybe angulata TaxID=980116 RepID=A0A8H6IDX5_9AGAR|nr:acyl-CoA N-acyltransferase [Tulosesus angulatus]